MYSTWLLIHQGKVKERRPVQYGHVIRSFHRVQCTQDGIGNISGDLDTWGILTLPDKTARPCCRLPGAQDVCVKHFTHYLTYKRVNVWDTHTLLRPFFDILPIREMNVCRTKCIGLLLLQGQMVTVDGLKRAEVGGSRLSLML